MHRQPFDVVRLFLSLFHDMPPLSSALYAPGAVLLLCYPMLSVALGPQHEGEAFATSFIVALAVRIAVGFEGMLKRLLARYSATRATVYAIAFAALPLVVLVQSGDPLWCQRIQSVFYGAIAGMFLLDVLHGRTDTAASFWPDAEMRGHLPNLTRTMVVYNLAFLLLNETLIHLVEAPQWMLFWAVLPILGHLVLRALVLTVINMDDGAAPT